MCKINEKIKVMVMSNKDNFSEINLVSECVSGLHRAMTSDESWVMKSYACILKGLVWLQAPLTPSLLL